MLSKSVPKNTPKGYITLHLSFFIFFTSIFTVSSTNSQTPSFVLSEHSTKNFALICLAKVIPSALVIGSSASDFLSRFVPTINAKLTISYTRKNCITVYPPQRTIGTFGEACILISGSHTDSTSSKVTRLSIE